MVALQLNFLRSLHTLHSLYGAATLQSITRGKLDPSWSDPDRHQKIQHECRRFVQRRALVTLTLEATDWRLQGQPDAVVGLSATKERKALNQDHSIIQLEHPSAKKGRAATMPNSRYPECPSCVSIPSPNPAQPSVFPIVHYPVASNYYGASSFCTLYSTRVLYHTTKVQANHS